VKKICDTILDAIGGTPLVRINRITKGIVKGTVLAKIETFNPGNSIKDRMAVKMIEDAEKAGLLKAGGTIVEGTSGNTGMGLAIAAVVKGYKCVFTTTDIILREKSKGISSTLAYCGNAGCACTSVCSRMARSSRFLRPV